MKVYKVHLKAGGDLVLYLKPGESPRTWLKGKFSPANIERIEFLRTQEPKHFEMYVENYVPMGYYGRKGVYYGD